MQARYLGVATALLVSLGLTTGCDDHFTNEGTEPEVALPDTRTFKGVGVGDPCEATADCRDGLLCTGGECVPGHNKAQDDKCLITAACQEGLHCGWAGFCVPGGEGGVGHQCATSAECKVGFYCDIQGVGGHCVAPNGTDADLDEDCSSTADCLAGLVCSATSDTCVPGSLLLTPDLFPGVECPNDYDAELPFGVRMALPGSEEDTDFYALPFPNDLHRDAEGHVDLDAHPRPGPGIIGLDPLGGVLDALKAEDTPGWSLYPGVFLRFTRPVDEDTLTSEGDGATLHFVDLDHDAPHPFTFQHRPERNKYICPNRLFAQPRLSHPLLPSTTYAFFVTSGVRAAPPEDDDVDPGELVPQRLEAIEALLSSSAPSGGAEKTAWDRYGKLRGYLGSHNLSADEVIGAAVFTTHAPREVMGEIRAAVHAATAPSVHSGYTVCLSGTVSPCADPDWAETELGAAGAPDPRSCPDAPSSKFYEVHTKVRLPVLQDGDRPYLDGGGGLHTSGGVAAAAGYEDVCVALAVPKNVEMPDAGWPIVIYGHGTGGSMRSGVKLLGEELATMETATDGSVGVALLAYDMPMHGERRGPGVDLDSGPLFYNYRNPVAAKANYYQGAADVMAFVRFVRDFDKSLPVLGPVKFDPARVAYHGHSQGGGQGPLVAPFEPDLPVMAISGTGGGVVDGFLGKKEPYDSSIGIRIMLHEIDVDEAHPALHIMQHYFDAIDPGVYGPLLDAPPSGKGIHLLHVWGHNDSYTPPVAMRTYAASANTHLAEPSVIPSWYDSLTDLQVQHVSLPAYGTHVVLGEEYTRVTIQAMNDPANSLTPGVEYDGHFVVYNDKDANLQLALFLRTWLFDGIPAVIDPP